MGPRDDDRYGVGKLLKGQLWLRRIKVWLRSRLWSATQVQPDLTNLNPLGPRLKIIKQRLSRRIVAQASAQSMERDDCDLRTDYGLMDERPVINEVRGEEVTEMQSSIRLNAEETCQGPSPWDSFGALVKTKVPTRLHRRAHASTP